LWCSPAIDDHQRRINLYFDSKGRVPHRPKSRGANVLEIVLFMGTLLRRKKQQRAHAPFVN
jgi:hypothetical protein